MKDNDNFFTLSMEESTNARASIAKALGWLALFFAVISTGIHAVWLAVTQTGGGEAGIMYAVRIASPVLVEVIAFVVAIGFASHGWRGAQKLVGTIIEVVWLIFAAMNLVSSFNMEGGIELSGFIWWWLHYGFPVSMLVSVALFYTLLRVDPEHKRQSEIQATIERHKMLQFGARQEVYTSDQMQLVERNKGWLEVVKGLEHDGYSNDQIAVVMQGVPELAPLLSGITSKPKEIMSRAMPQPHHGENAAIAFAAESPAPQPAIVETAVDEPEAEAQPEKDVNFTPPQPEK